jgi:hypothetical protein
MDPADAPTEQISRQASAPGIHVRVGRSKWSLPVGTVISAGLVAAAATWGVVKSERDELWASLARAQAELRDQRSGLEAERQRGSYVQTQLARIDARLAEIQVILMQQARAR